MIGAHIADVHLGITRYQQRDPATGLNIRSQDFNRAFEEALEKAMSEHVDFILIAGDLFHSRNPYPLVKEFALDRLHKVGTNGTPVFIVSGNHEAPVTRGVGNPLAVLKYLPNVYVFREPGCVDLSIKGKDLSVLGVPYNTAQPMNELFSEQQWPQTLSRHRKGFKNILLSHGSIEGFAEGAETMISTRLEGRIPLERIPPDFDYIAMGHIHRSQVLYHSQNPSLPIVYPGSLERVDFRERNEEKGFYLLDMTGDEPSLAFEPVQARKMIELSPVDCTGKDGPQITREAATVVRTSDVSGKIVGLTLTGSLELSAKRMLDTSSIKEAARRSGAFELLLQRTYGIVHPSLQREVGRYLYPPQQELEEYLKSATLPDPLKQRILQLGTRIIQDTGSR